MAEDDAIPHAARDKARYLYLDASKGAPFLGRAYFPGRGSPGADPDGANLPPEAGAQAASETPWIPFKEGELTDGDLKTKVSGWNPHTEWKKPGCNDGPYVLFDLGATYRLGKVRLHLSNEVGRRWYSGDDLPMQVWTADDLPQEPGQDVALTKSATTWNQTPFTLDNNADGETSSDVVLEGNYPARYVLLLLRTAQVDSKNAGGILREVTFHTR
jgi:hypothetical protein